MSKLSLRRGPKAVAVDYVRLSNSPSTRKDIARTFLMKPIPFVFLAVMAIATPVFSQVEKTTSQVASPSPTHAARILGDLPDGTPPPPEPPKPTFIVPAKDVLETETIEQGGRTITIQEIKPIELLPTSAAPAPPDLDKPAVQARLAEYRANHPQIELIRLGACVYHPEDSAPRTLVTYWTAAGEAPITFWSSADFSLLTGLVNFVGTDGQTRSLLMAWSTAHIEQSIESLANSGREPTPPPEIPQFPTGKATFIIATGTPTAENLASIQALHDVYNKEYEKLKAACERREQARLQQEAELKAHPPQPKNITLSHWRINSPAQATGKGAAR